MEERCYAFGLWLRKAGEYNVLDLNLSIKSIIEIRLHAGFMPSAAWGKWNVLIFIALSLSVSKWASERLPPLACLLCNMLGTAHGQETAWRNQGTSLGGLIEGLLCLVLNRQAYDLYKPKPWFPSIPVQKCYDWWKNKPSFACEWYCDWSQHSSCGYIRFS